MKFNKENNSSSAGDRMKIKVSNNGPYIVSGRIPLIKKEIRNDSDGYCSTWYEVLTYPLKEQYALCRCGQSKTKPFCDGMRTKIHFDGKETADDTPYLEKAERIDGPTLSMTDADGMCVHARFCMRAGGIWNLIRQSDNPEAREPLKRRETVRQDDSLSMITSQARHLNRNLKNPL